MKLGLGLETCRERSKINAAAAADRCAVRTDFATTIANLEKRVAADKIALLTQALSDARVDAQTPLWARPGIVAPIAFTTGLVVSAGVVYGAVWAAARLGLSFR